MRVDFGYQLFKFLGDLVVKFLNFIDPGCELVFGKNFRDHYFIFKAMPSLIYFSAVVHVLAHFGILNYLILKISYFYTVILGTSPTESLVAIGSVFVGTVFYLIYF